MANLIEQMNVLKALEDASLQGEIQSPYGSGENGGIADCLAAL